ncbi:MAG: RluA family pseudouridine synthase, partial [Myxococcales bacterium]|nr:RluA family pseudouridine synthase [Myxococcales bacterium]
MSAQKRKKSGPAPGRTQAMRLGPTGAGAERAVVTVPPALAGERLDKALAALVPALSRAFARKVVGLGGVYLGLSRCRVASKPVEAGDVLTATWHPDVSAPERFPLVVVYEDADVVVVDKASGQLSQGSELGDEGSLTRDLERRFGRDIRLMHRLDKGASGLLVAARTARASAALTPQVREHTMSRRYLALAAGVPADGACERPLIADGRRMRVAEPHEDGLPARSDVRVVRAGEGAALVEVVLFTGRTHQIRVHMSHIGHPLLGDQLYGSGFATKAVRLPAD